MKKLNINDSLALVKQILEDNKALNIYIIDIRNKTAIADYMIIASGSSAKHLETLKEKICIYMKKEHSTSCITEGKNGSLWLVVDLANIIIHLFHPAVREYYEIEKIWDV